MTEEITFGKRNIRFDYDDEWLTGLLRELGIEPAAALKYTKLAVVYYSSGELIGLVYDKIGEAHGVRGETVSAHIKKGITNAVYNGKLKTIDDYFHSEFYDYDNGFSNKEFIATINEYMRNMGKLSVCFETEQTQQN